MATYSFVTNANQEALVTFAATKTGAASNDAFVQAQFARILQRARNERDLDDTNKVGAAYLAATPAVQAQVKTLLGVP